MLSVSTKNKISSFQLIVITLLSISAIALAMISMKISNQVQAAPVAPPAGTVPLFNMYNPKTDKHFYTAFECERQYVIKKGFRTRAVTAWVYQPTTEPAVCSTSD